MTGAWDDTTSTGMDMDEDFSTGGVILVRSMPGIDDEIQMAARERIRKDIVLKMKSGWQNPTTLGKPAKGYGPRKTMRIRNILKS